MARHEHEHEHKHEHGSMDITQQERTFHGFLKACTWVVIATLVVLIFLALVNA
jgi:uncharacterized membrane protein